MSIAVDKRTLEIAVKYDKTRQEINKVTDELKEQNRELKKLEAEKVVQEKMTVAEYVSVHRIRA